MSKNRATVSSVELSFEDTGGVPVLFVHGFPLDHTMWEAQLEGLKVPNRLIAPDLRGFGESSMPNSPYDCYGIDAYATDLKNLLDALHLQKVVMVGLSMGGYVTFAFHRLFPDRLKGVVLVDTHAGADSPEKRQGRMATMETVRNEGIKPVAEEMVQKLFSSYTLNNKPELVKKVREMICRQPAAGIIGALKAMADRPDSKPELPNIRVPTMVVVGSEDIITPPERAMEMAKRIPDSRLITIPKAGHLTPLEMPDVFNQALREFIAGLR